MQSLPTRKRSLQWNRNTWLASDGFSCRQDLVERNRVELVTQLVRGCSHSGKLGNPVEKTASDLGAVDAYPGRLKWKAFVDIVEEQRVGIDTELMLDAVGIAPQAGSPARFDLACLRLHPTQIVTRGAGLKPF